MKLKLFDEKTIERLIILNMIILIILLISNLIGIGISFFKTNSLRDLNLEALFELYLFLIIYIYIYFKNIKTKKEK